MKSLADYESFCRLYKDDPRLQIVQSLRCWLIRRQNADTGGRDYTDFDELTSVLDNQQLCDGVSRVVDMTEEAFSHIVNSPRSEIIRENVLLPLHKVKEIDGYCVRWLSRRNGRTVREKLATTTSMMAVHRRESLDTGENRLLKSFAARMVNLIQLKQEFLPLEYLSEKEKNFARKALLLAQNDDFQEVRSWENLPPNNTLLSDKYYSKIWHGWQELQELDDIIKDDCDKLAERLRTYFTWRLIQEARKYFVFPQSPIEWSYRDFRIDVGENIVSGYDEYNKEELLFFWNNDDACLRVKSNNREYHLTFTPEAVDVSDSGKNSHFDIIPGKIEETLFAVAELLWQNDSTIELSFTNKTRLRGGSAIIDLLAVRPRCAMDDEPPERLKFRLMRQAIGGSTNEESEFDISAAFSTAFYYKDGDWEPYTLNRILADDDINEKDELAVELLRLLNDHLDVKKLTILFPDLYDDFQLAPIRRAAHLYYANVQSLPKSVAAVFSRESRESFRREFKYGEPYVVADTVNGRLSLTLIRSQKDPLLEKALPERIGILWERHPEENFTLDVKETENKEGRNPWQDSYGASNAAEEQDPLRLKIGDQWHSFLLGSSGKSIKEKINISRFLKIFLDKRQKYINGQKVRILLLSPNLICCGNEEFESVTVDDCLSGARYSESLSEKLNGNEKLALWSDHLPDLAIKLLYGKFDLVRDIHVRPVVNQDVSIPIKDVFKLRKGIAEYHFQLVKSDGGEKMLYEAVVKHRVFPLDQDVLCRLRMTYRYGSDSPYMLYFEPIEQEAQLAGFSSIEVEWKRMKEYPYENLPVPQFPSPPSWEELRRNPEKNKQTGELTGKTRNLFDWVIQKLNRAVLLDFSNFEQSIMGYQGYRKIVVKDSEEQRFIIIEEKSFEGSISFGEHLHRISVRLDPVDETCYADDLEWITTKNTGKRMAFWEDEYGQKIAFFGVNFLDQNEYEEEPCAVYFIKRHNRRTEKLYADYIRSENWPVFIAKGAVTDGEEDFRKLDVFYPLHTIFSGGRSLESPECPGFFREAIVRDVPYLIQLLQTTESSFVKTNIVKILSLVSCSLCKDFYPIACRMLEEYDNGAQIPYEIGILVGNAASKDQLEILNRICMLKDKRKAVCLLSRALWKSPYLIFKLQIDMVMDYFEEAVKMLNGPDTLRALEYILAVFRLRSLNDAALNKKLSLNNPTILSLRSVVEEMISMAIKEPDRANFYNSRINFDIKTKAAAEKQKIPVFLYALLCYITGETDENQIEITEITED